MTTQEQDKKKKKLKRRENSSKYKTHRLQKKDEKQENMSIPNKIQNKVKPPQLVIFLLFWRKRKNTKLERVLYGKKDEQKFGRKIFLYWNNIRMNIETQW
jgi:hypothetical protein